MATGTRDDVDVGLEPAAHHAERVGDPVLPVHDELAREDVEDLELRRNRHRARRVERALDVLARDLAVLRGHRDDLPAVERLDGGPGDAHDRALDLGAGHDLGLLRRALDRVDRDGHVDDGALARALVRGGALADDVDAARRVRFGDQGADLRRSDVEADEVRSGFRHP